VEGLAADTAAEPSITSYIKGGFNIIQGKIMADEVSPDGGGVLYWQFPTAGKPPSHCIGALCDVDAVTGEVRWTWLCL
jgi:hypothetical protein